MATDETGTELHAKPFETTAEVLRFRSLSPQREPERQAPVAAPQTAAAHEVDHAAELRAAHERGRQEAMAEASASTARHTLEEQEHVRRRVEQFEQEKQRYFADVEGEVVKLSLAIAERVLHREAGMDPMLLAGAARVALGQVADTSEAVLRVPPTEIEQWNRAVADSVKGIIVQADEELPAGECVLKTRSGTVQLGLRAQLQEIERGFFELLNRRPSMAV